LPDEISTEKNKNKFEFNRKTANANLERILKSKDNKYEALKSGKVSIRDFSYAYANNNPVLKSINLEINHGDKIGVIGRTGAGKSSLISALYRIRPPLSGIVEIDGQIDRSLFELRINLSIIPQEPIIFADSVRVNLDPFDSYSEDELWNILESIGLKNKFKEDGLEHELDEGGKTLSVGEKQLVCLGRAMLKKSKILFIDEATANVDLETDAFIQTQIRKLFKNATVITIAHRLKTIVDSDKIAILEKGKLVEFESPKQLIKVSQLRCKSYNSNNRQRHQSTKTYHTF